MKRADPNVAVEDFIESLLATPERSHAAVSRWLAEFVLLIDEATREVAELPTYDSEFMLDWEGPVREASRIMFDGPRNALAPATALMTDVVLYALRREDSRGRGGRRLARLVQAGLLRRLREVELMVSSARVVGLDGVQRAADTLFAAYGRAPIANRSKVKEWLASVFGGIQGASKGLQAIEAGVHSTQNLIEMLPSGPS